MTETTDARKRRLEGERVAGDAVAEVAAAEYVEDVRAAIKAQALDRFTTDYLAEDARDWLAGFSARAALSVLGPHLAERGRLRDAVKALAAEWEAEAERLKGLADSPDADELRESLMRESGTFRGPAIVLRALLAEDGGEAVDR